MIASGLHLPPLTVADTCTLLEAVAALAHLGALEERLRARLAKENAPAAPPVARVDPARVLSPKRVGELLGVSTYTAQEMIRTGELPSVPVRDGGRRGVRHVALVRHLEARELGPLAPGVAGAYSAAHDTNGAESPTPTPRPLTTRARARPRRRHDDGSAVGARRAPDKRAHRGDPDTPSARDFALPRDEKGKP